MTDMTRSARNTTSRTDTRLLVVPLAMASLIAACTSVPLPPDVPPVPVSPSVTIPAPVSAPVPAPAPAPVPVALSPEEQTLQSIVAAQDRLYRVAAPLLVNNAELCRNNSRNLLGFTAKNQYGYSPDLMPAAQALYSMSERLRVTAVLVGSGAERAGVRRGDVLVSVEGRNFPAGENAERQTAALLGPLVSERNSLRLGLRRGEAAMTLTVPLTHACAFSIELGNADLVNAYADGHRILITRGMLNTAQDDEELAAVIAREMSHNILAHAARQNQSANAGAIIDNLVRVRPNMTSMVGLSGLRPLPPELDASADRLSFYLLARAGYDITRAIPFWKRLAEQYPASIPNGYTAQHPDTEQRLAAMERALRDIEAKREANLPLMP